MNAFVVYESVYGNTRAVAQAVADGLDGAEVVPVYEARERVHDVGLLIVGGPTHMHGLTTTRSRRMAVEAVREDGGQPAEPAAASEPGLRAWLRDMPQTDGVPAAAFDTRLDKSPWLTGVASRGIAKRLHARGYDVLGTSSFLVADSEGPLEEGELERARAWGRELAAALANEAVQEAAR